jgi:hypothetical protein
MTEMCLLVAGMAMLFPHTISMLLEEFYNNKFLEIFPNTVSPLRTGMSNKHTIYVCIAKNSYIHCGGAVDVITTTIKTVHEMSAHHTHMTG